MAVATPLVLFLGGHIVEALLVALISSALMLTANILVSAKLLPELFQSSLNKKNLKPMLSFGGGWLVAGIAATLLVNLEKIFWQIWFQSIRWHIIRWHLRLRIWRQCFPWR